MNVATKVVGALVLVVILISALYGVGSQIIKDAGQKGQDAGNNRSNLLGCVARNAQKENPRRWCKKNTGLKAEGVEPTNA